MTHSNKLQGKSGRRTREHYQSQGGCLIIREENPFPIDQSLNPEHVVSFLSHESVPLGAGKRDVC